ncbi:unnamed protein product [Knipowitschia caucasica]
MPRKKKGGQSPARVPSGLQLEGGDHTGSRPPMANSFLPGSAAQENIVRSMQEMFSHLDPEVVYIVLSECDFKVENATDALLELSVAAADPQPVSLSASGFERTAAALLEEPSSQTDQSTHLERSSTSPTCFLTDDVDFLIEQEVQSLCTQENNVDQHQGCHSLSEDQHPECSGTSTDNSLSLNCLQNPSKLSSLDQLCPFEDIYIVKDEQVPIETTKGENTHSEDLSIPGHSSEYSIPTNQNNNDTNPTKISVSEASVAKVRMSDSFPSLTWNIDAPAFQPQVQQIQGNAFITPVASDWTRGTRPPLSWNRPISQAHLRPHPAKPKMWARPPPQPPSQASQLRLEGKVLVLLRGLPGSGKSTLARALLEHNRGGVILSTDDYFIVNGEYKFDLSVLGEAHDWNHDRARLAFEKGANPIIIDNTNMCGWEMRPYVVQALKHDYKVYFREPDTWWKYKPRELERRTKHGVPLERIKHMLSGYERFVTVKSIMGSQMPERKQTVATGELLKPEVPCSVLEGESNNLNAEAVCSPPDISTNHESKHLKDEQEHAYTEREEVAQIYSDSGTEPAITEDHCLDEPTVAFSESIGQRVKRERAIKTSSVDHSEPAEESNNTDESQEEVLSQQRETTAEENTNSNVKIFDFEGDWPSAVSLDQRQEKRHEGRNIENHIEDDNLKNVDPGSGTKDMPEPDLTELQKLFDMIQTVSEPVNTASSSLLPLSVISGDQDVTSAIKRNPDIIEGITREPPDDLFDSQTAGCSSDREKKLVLEQDGSQSTSSCDEVSENPELESLGKSESNQISPISGGTERKQCHTRRLGKPCKLALTFSHNCLDTSVDCADSLSEAQSNEEPKCDLKTDCTLPGETNTTAEDETHPCTFSQTESQDFALLWRVNQRSLDASDASTKDFRMLYSNPTRFLPKMASPSSSIDPTKHKEVPYSVVYEKSTQVEEKEFGTSEDMTENLLILRRHFKQVTSDTLEDLYEKCQKDIEWTTNLLLDSGERFFRADEKEEDDGSCVKCEDGASIDLSSLQDEEVSSSKPEVVVEEIDVGAASAPNVCDSSAVCSTQDKSSVSLDEKEEGNFKTHQVTESTSDLSQTVTIGDSVEARPCEGGDSGTSLGREDLAETEEDISSMCEIPWGLLAELELEREETEREALKARMKDVKQKNKPVMDIKSVELKLPTELALQLIELFGPVGVDSDTASPEDYVLQMDLHLAKLLHQKLKDSVQERQKQATLSFQLLQESSAQWDKTQSRHHQRNRPSASHHDRSLDAGNHLPFMDHWNVSRPHVSFRDIIQEEMALQENREEARPDKCDGATPLKEDQLFALFPAIDRHFLQDVFRAHNYSLNQTELFLRSLLEEGSVKTVVAPESPRMTQHSKDREKKSTPTVYQDTEDPEYEDFRAEANLQHRRQLENFAKATEAFQRGHKEVASFYAQQGHLHAQRMREANHRAAVQIFERVNSSLLPQNVLDLHGLHVDEALEHLNDVLQRKAGGMAGGVCTQKQTLDS